MKKILFLLLCSVVMYGQVPADATPLENVQITNNVISTTAPFVNVQSSTGVVNKINKTDLVDAIIVNTTAELTPAIGNVNKLYATRDNTLIYRYNGTIYVPIGGGDVSGKEDIANKQNSLASDGTNLKYPTVTAVNAGLGLKANNTDVVFLAGNQSISGQKNFNSTATGQTALTITNSATSFTNPSLKINHDNTTASGATGLDISSTLGGVNNFGIAVTTRLGTAIRARQVSSSSGNGIVSEGQTGATGFVYVGQNDGVNTFTVNKEGNIVANTYTGGATLTGAPTAPTPTVATGIANKGYVDGVITTADAGNMKLTGDQSATGQKTFNSLLGKSSIFIVNAFANSFGLQVDNSNTSSGIKSNNSSTGSGIVSNQTSTGMGFNYVGQNNGSNTYTVDKLGATTATSFINSSAPAANVLLAGGGTLAQTGLPYLPLSGGTLTGGLTAPTFNGALNGNAITASNAFSRSFKIEGSIPFLELRNTNTFTESYSIFASINETLSGYGNYLFFNAPVGKEFYFDKKATFSSTVTAAGATLTGALNGTSATFSSSVTTNVGNLQGITVSSSNSGFLEVGKVGGSRWRFSNDFSGDFLEVIYGASGATPSSSLFKINPSGAATFSSTVTASNGQLLGGTGTTNFLPKFTGTGTVGNSIVFDNGTNIGIGVTTPNAKIHVRGGMQSNSIADVSTTGSFRIDAANPALSAVFGYDASDNVFLQAVNSTTNTVKPLLINPFGGNTLIGTTADNGSKLQVAGAATFSSTVTASLLKPTVYTVATLPTPPSTGTGTYATVSDAVAPAYLTPVMGGGAVVTPVFYNGSNWICH